MTKKDRQIIFDKYNGHCAYCGCELEKGWHIDELIPVQRGFEYITNEKGKRVWDFEKGEYKKKFIIEHPENFNINNQMPACASCNINKHSMSLEDFRLLIQGFIKHLNEINTQYKIAKRYGLVKEEIKPVVFYFETFNK
jgi:5-methylcytosine-specific restriction endonuclease McrA